MYAPLPRTGREDVSGRPNMQCEMRKNIGHNKHINAHPKINNTNQKLELKKNMGGPSGPDLDKDPGPFRRPGSGPPR